MQFLQPDPNSGDQGSTQVTPLTQDYDVSSTANNQCNLQYSQIGLRAGQWRISLSGQQTSETCDVWVSNGQNNIDMVDGTNRCDVTHIPGT